jgi:hypothetical protein
MGHVQGLDHTCKDDATPANAVDDQGNPPPDCSMIATLPFDERIKIAEATMFNSAGPLDTQKRTPKADDIAGICAAYPLAKDPKVCQHVNLHDYDRGCSVSLGGRPGANAAAWIAGLGLLAWAGWRKRRLGG